MSKQNVKSTANPADQISEEQLHTVSAGALEPVPQDKDETPKNLPTFRDAPKPGWLSK